MMRGTTGDTWSLTVLCGEDILKEYRCLSMNMANLLAGIFARMTHVSYIVLEIDA